MRSICIALLLVVTVQAREPNHNPPTDIPKPDLKPDPKLVQLSRNADELTMSKRPAPIDVYATFRGKPYTGWVHIKEGKVVTGLTHWKNGVLDGKSYTWWVTGKLQSIEYHKRGKEDDRFLMWFPDGTLHQDATFNNGNAITTRQWHGDGKLSVDLVADENGQDHGEQFFFHKTGKLFVKMIREHGKSVGDWKFYNDKGQHRVTQHWKNGKLFKTTDEKGKTISHKEGKKRLEVK